MKLTPLEQAVYDHMQKPNVDYITAATLASMHIGAGKRTISCDEYAAWRTTHRKKINRAMLSLLQKAKIVSPGGGKFAALPVRSVADFTATLKPWDCVKVQVEPGDWEWLVCVDGAQAEGLGLQSVVDDFYMYNDGTKSSFRKMPGEIHLHEIDTADVRNVKPGV